MSWAGTCCCSAAAVAGKVVSSAECWFGSQAEGGLLASGGGEDLENSVPDEISRWISRRKVGDAYRKEEWLCRQTTEAGASEQSRASKGGPQRSGSNAQRQRHRSSRE